MTIFEPEVEYILNVMLSTKSKTNDIRQMLTSNDNLYYKSARQMETKHVYTITRDIISAPTKLKEQKAARVVNMI